VKGGIPNLSDTSDMPTTDFANPHAIVLPDPADPECIRALATVRDELLAIPSAEVQPPQGGEQWIAATRALGPLAVEIEVRRDRIALLARALVRAQRDFAWEPPAPKRVANYDALVAELERTLGHVEGAARQLVRRGLVARRDLPQCPALRTIDDRCRHLCELVEVLEGHERELGDVPTDLLRRAANIASRLDGARPLAPASTSARELRDRAYTALCAELRGTLDAEPHAERSGTFVVHVVDGVLRDVRRA
jgi:hypothetical protein